MNSIIKTRIEEINSGKVPSGYKKTKIGIFPVEWEEKKLSEYLLISNEKNKDTKYGKKDVFSVSGEMGVVNQIVHMGRSYAGESVDTYNVVYPNDIVYTKSPLKNNPYGIIKANLTNIIGIVSVLYAVFHPKDNIIPEYVQFYFENDVTLNNYLLPLVEMGPKHTMNIGDKTSLQGHVVFPSIKEQEKIAEILKTQDRIIELKEKLLKEKQREKKYLMQQLLTGKIRLKGFTDEWEKINVGKVIEEVSFRNSDGQLRNVMSVSNDRGFIDQSTQFDKIVASKDTTNYKIVKKGIFAYNPSRVNVGSLALYMDENESIVSPMYITFKCNNAEDRYLYLWFKSFMFISQLKKYLSGSVRDSLNINDLFLFNIALPGLAEQQAIVKVIMTKDREIALIKQQIENEKQKKKALMQLLLSGIVRVS